MTKTKKVRIEKQLAFREAALENLYKAYELLSSGAVKSYMIDDRQLTRYDLSDLWDQIKDMEAEIDDLENQLDSGLRNRRAFGVIPLDL